MYNYIEKEKKWLDVAANICEFCLDHGRDERGVWGYLVDREGNMIEGEKAIQVDAFAIMGLTEYAQATGDERAIEAAVQTFHSVQDRLSRPGSYGTHPYPIPQGMKAHRDHFQFAFAFYELGVYLDRKDILDEALSKADEVMDNFRRPEREVLVEYVTLDNRMVDSPPGRAMVPGHAVECMWFMIHIFRHFKNRERIDQAIETIRWALEKGWDQEYGGILLGIDIDGKEPLYWRNADTKIWWVFSEALYALLLAYEHSRESWCMDWYWKVHDWSFAHFPVREHGEWTQKLDRQGNKIDRLIALPVKDPFHLPRALILCIDVLKRLTAES
jgi:N-acylglucosamine 2-epimerase